MFLRFLFGALFLCLGSGCTELLSETIDAEPAIGLIGGLVLSTQNSGRVALTPPKKTSTNPLQFLFPIQEACAAIADCPAITAGSCDGTKLVLYYQNCQTSAFSRAGYWHSYQNYTFPLAGDCTTVLGSGFTAGVVAGLTGKTVQRTYGNTPGDDQNNIRVGLNGEVVYFYSDFPSGWREDKIGGAQITFEAGGVRRIIVDGVHALGISHSLSSAVGYIDEDVDLPDLPTTGETVRTVWDHTISTVQDGDALFDLGNTISQSSSGGAISFGSTQNDVFASFDGDIVVSGTTVARGATLLIQHNISESIGVLVVTEPLEYSDSSCCWPMSGEIKTRYDLNLRSPTLEETIVFNGESCGSITYSSTAFRNEARTLSHCF